MKMEPLINYFKDKRIFNILDVGTGSGGFIPILQQTFPEAKITGIHVQFFFENKKNINLIENKSDMDSLVEKMQQMLEKIKGHPEYDIMNPEIETFRKKALKFGIQPATNFIIVARKKILN